MLQEHILLEEQVHLTQAQQEEHTEQAEPAEPAAQQEDTNPITPRKNDSEGLDLML